MTSALCNALLLIWALSCSSYRNRCCDQPSVTLMGRTKHALIFCSTFRYFFLPISLFLWLDAWICIVAVSFLCYISVLLEFRFCFPVSPTLSITAFNDYCFYCDSQMMKKKHSIFFVFLFSFSMWLYFIYSRAYDEL